MADELKNTKLFQGSIEEPKIEPLLPQPFLPLFQGTSDEEKPEPLLPNPILPIFNGSTDEVKPEPLTPAPIQPFLGGGQEQSIASYDYFDIAEGTGIKSFNPVVFGTRASDYERVLINDFLNTKETWTSGGIVITGAPFISTSGSVLDINFSLSPFNTPKAINGNLYIHQYWQFYRNIANNANCSGGLNYFIQRVRNGVAETIASTSGSIASFYGTGAAVAQMEEILKVSVTNQHFKIGDVLRLRENAWLWLSGGATQPISLSAKVDYNVLSGGILYVPFKLNL